MSSNNQPRPGLTDYSHPADDPAQIEAMRMAIALRDIPVARSIAGDVLDARVKWEREHPAGTGACPEDEPCGACAAAYAEPDGEEDSEAAESGEETV